jgi:membrane protein implicated in regulation of membrane protease activity
VERFLLYLDDIDDLFGMLALMGERLRNLFIAATSLLMMLAVTILAAMLAYELPTIALAIAIVLLATLLYRAVTRPPGSNQVTPLS